MAIDISKIMLSRAKVYRAATGTAGPADSVAADGAWPVGWTHVGATSAATVFAYEYDDADADIQDALTPVRRRRKSEKGTLETVLAELSADHLDMAWDGTVTATASGVGTMGKKTFKIGGRGRRNVYKWGFEGKYEDESGNIFPVRAYIHKATSASGGKLEFVKDKYIGIPLKLMALADTSQSEGDQLIAVDIYDAPAS